MKKFLKRLLCILLIIFILFCSMILSYAVAYVLGKYYIILGTILVGILIVLFNLSLASLIAMHINKIIVEYWNKED